MSREKQWRKWKKKKKTKISTLLAYTYLRPVKTKYSSFFRSYYAGKQRKKKKKRRKKLKFQHFWLKPTYLKIIVFSFFFLFLWTFPLPHLSYTILVLCLICLLSKESRLNFWNRRLKKDLMARGMREASLAPHIEGEGMLVGGGAEREHNNCCCDSIHHIPE